MRDQVIASVEGGKYTPVQQSDGGLWALRYGEPWRNCVGDGRIYALGARVSELEEALRRIRDAALSVSRDYSTAIDMLEYPDEAEESNVLLDELLAALAMAGEALKK